MTASASIPRSPGCVGSQDRADLPDGDGEQDERCDDQDDGDRQRLRCQLERHQEVQDDEDHGQDAGAREQPAQDESTSLGRVISWSSVSVISSPALSPTVVHRHPSRRRRHYTVGSSSRPDATASAKAA